LERGAREIRTPQGIRDFYAEVKGPVREKVEVTHFVSDATGIAAELPTEFRGYRGWEGGFFGRLKSARYTLAFPATQVTVAACAHGPAVPAGVT